MSKIAERLRSLNVGDRVLWRDRWKRQDGKWGTTEVIRIGRLYITTTGGTQWDKFTGDCKGVSEWKCGGSEDVKDYEVQDRAHLIASRINSRTSADKLRRIEAILDEADK